VGLDVDVEVGQALADGIEGFRDVRPGELVYR
jgi:hypothetical protein